jgi:hypothetical protein
VKDRRPAFEPWRNAKSWVQSLFGLGLAASLAPSAAAARKNDGKDNKRSDEDPGKKSREDDEAKSSKRDDEGRDNTDESSSRKSDKRGDDQSSESSGKNKDRDGDSDKAGNDESSKGSKRAEKQDDAANDDASRDKDRKGNRQDDNQASNSDDSAGDTAGDEATPTLSRREARRQAKQAASAEDDTDDADGGGDRRARKFEQSADDDSAQADDGQTDPELTAATDHSPATTPAHIGIAQTNPHVDLDDVPAVADVPDLSDAEVVVQANDNVIAGVSPTGGFAFARSGDMTVISGPDGPRIIQGTIEEVVVPVDDEPADDGGNNDVEFSS